MKIYINAYAKKRKKLNKTMDKYGELIAEHLAKCAMYGDTLKNGKYKHWIEDELATWIIDINESICKQNNKKLKPVQYADVLFGDLGDSMVDARVNLHLLQEQNKKSEHPYPFRKVDDDMINRMFKISQAVIQKFPPLLATVNTLSKADIEFMLHQIIDPVCAKIK